MHVQTQFSIFLVNKPGVLAAVTGALAKHKINLRALSLSDSGEHGVLRVVAEDTSAIREVLKRTQDRWTETDVLVIQLDNHPGSFARVAEALANEHVNILYAYCTGGAPRGKTTAVFKVADLKKAEKVVQAMQNHKKPDGDDFKAPPTRD